MPLNRFLVDLGITELLSPTAINRTQASSSAPDEKKKKAPLLLTLH